MKNNGVLIFLGICILMAGGFIGGGLNTVADSINQHNPKSSVESYRVIVQDGIIYRYDTATGEIWKKADTSDSNWEFAE